MHSVPCVTSCEITCTRARLPWHATRSALRVCNWAALYKARATAPPYTASERYSASSWITALTSNPVFCASHLCLAPELLLLLFVSFFFLFFSPLTCDMSNGWNPSWQEVKIHGDFHQKVIIQTEDLEWKQARYPGVDRKCASTALPLVCAVGQATPA